MSKKIKIPISIKHPSFRENGMYFKAVETKDYIFYCNYREGDENAGTVMFNREMKLISDNYFAFVGLWEAIGRKQYTHLSPTVKMELRMPEMQKQIADWVEADNDTN